MGDSVIDPTSSEVVVVVAGIWSVCGAALLSSRKVPHRCCLPAWLVLLLRVLFSAPPLLCLKLCAIFYDINHSCPLAWLLRVAHQFYTLRTFSPACRCTKNHHNIKLCSPPLEQLCDCVSNETPPQLRLY